jgi:hypothetical protein
MADTPRTLTPAPAVTPDAAATYRPVSGLAVAALGVAVLAAVVIVIAGVAAKLKGRPVLLPSLFLLAGLGLALSLTARWQIRRAEGTRAGIKLANWGLWLSLLFGLGYAAYYAATDLALREQAEGIADRWFAFLAKGEAEKAFRLTRPPGQQRGLPEDNPEEIRKRFGATELAIFLRSDLPRMFRTWPDKTRVQFVGVRDSDITPQGYQVDLNYEVRTPEGLYTVIISTLGHDDPATGGRDWQVVFNRSGTSRDKPPLLTKLGRMTYECQAQIQRLFLPAWQKSLGENAPIESLLRIEGNVPPDAQRAALAKEIHSPGAVTLYPGSSPLAPPGLPTAHFTDTDVQFQQNIEISLPTLGGTIPATLSIRSKDDHLVADMLRLAGPGWEQQPAEPTTDRPAELTPYDISFKVTEINIKPSAQKLTPLAPNEMPR